MYVRTNYNYSLWLRPFMKWNRHDTCTLPRSISLSQNFDKLFIACRRVTLRLLSFRFWCNMLTAMNLWSGQWRWIRNDSDRTHDLVPFWVVVAVWSHFYVENRMSLDQKKKRSKLNQTTKTRDEPMHISWQTTFMFRKLKKWTPHAAGLFYFPDPTSLYLHTCPFIPASYQGHKFTNWSIHLQKTLESC